MNRRLLLMLAAGPLALLPAWLVGHALTFTFSSSHDFIADSLPRYWPYLALLLRVTLIGLVLALIANSLGLAALRVLLPERRAYLFGLLVSSILWVALLGVLWNRDRDEFLAQIWLLILGVAVFVFIAIWGLLGMRAAAAVDPLSAGGTLLLAAFVAYFGSIGAFLALMNLFPGLPDLAQYTLFAFVIMAVGYLAQGLAVAGMAAVCTGVWQSFAGRSGIGPSAPMENPLPPEV